MPRCRGLHARAGVGHAIIDHIYTERGAGGAPQRPRGGPATNAALAGTYDVPVALVSGDQALAAEARDCWARRSRR